MSNTPIYTTADDAVKLVKSGTNLYIQGCASVPNVLIKALAKRASELHDVKVFNTFPIGMEEFPLCRPECRESFEINSFFLANPIRPCVTAGYGQVIPAFFGEIPDLFRKGHIHIDTVVLNCSLPDENGYCSYAMSAENVVAALESATTVIAQINPRLPYTQGDALIHVSRLDACVYVDEEPFILDTAVITPEEQKMGQYIAELVPDGATLQIGVGSVPNAILSALTNHKHLGLHTEALTDGVVPLIEKGIIDNSEKVVMPGKTVFTLALGSRRLYDWMDRNPDLVVKDVAWTNSPYNISANPKVMAVNSAIEIDLTGQICADSIGTRIYSNAGGQHDFMYGGSLSKGGKTFIAMPSLSAKGKSKINPILTPGAGVVTTRFQTQYVVTEWGVAFLLGKGLAERARALINIAHPSVREELERAAHERFGHSFDKLK